MDVKEVARLQRGLEAMIDHAMTQFIDETGCIPVIDSTVHEMQTIGGPMRFVPQVQVRAFVIPVKEH